MTAGNAGLRERAARDGCLWLPQLLPRRPVRALHQTVVGAARTVGLLDRRGSWCAGPAPALHELPPWIALQGAVAASEPFQALSRHAALLDLLQRLFGTPAQPDQGSVCRVAPPERLAPATPAHRDGDYIRGRPGLWTAWVPLVDCPIELGVLALLPGSHGDGAAQGWTARPMRVGDVLLFHLMTLHRACPNLSLRRVRLSADFRYRPAPA